MLLSDPDEVEGLVEFLRDLDYGAVRVQEAEIEVTAPSRWPESLGVAALDRFLALWSQAHPEVGVRVGGPFV